MNKLMAIICFLFLQLGFQFTANAQANILFPDGKDSQDYLIAYHVYAEGELGNLRDNLQGVLFHSPKVNTVFKINSRKVTNVLFLRVLSKKSAPGNIEQIHLYSVRDRDTKLIEEFTLLRSANQNDIDLLAAKLKL